MLPHLDDLLPPASGLSGDAAVARVTSIVRRRRRRRVAVRFVGAAAAVVAVGLGTASLVASWRGPDSPDDAPFAAPFAAVTPEVVEATPTATVGALVEATTAVATSPPTTPTPRPTPRPSRTPTPEPTQEAPATPEATSPPGESSTSTVETPQATVPPVDPCGNLAVQTFAFGVAELDLDADGRLDVLTAHRASRGAQRWQVSLSDGRLTSALRLPAGAFASAARADLDGDGRAEILARAGDDGRGVVLRLVECELTAVTDAETGAPFSFAWPRAARVAVTCSRTTLRVFQAEVLLDGDGPRRQARWSRQSYRLRGGVMELVDQRGGRSGLARLRDLGPELTGVVECGEPLA